MSEEVVKAPDTPAEVPAVPAENVTDVQKIPEQATEAGADKAPEKDEQPTPEQAAKRESRRFERRMANVLRREAEARARADILEKQLEETRKSQSRTEDTGAPRLEDFTDIEDFRKAVDKHAYERGLKESEIKRQSDAAKREQEALVASWEKKVDKGADKYDDFAEKVGELNPAFPWAQAIMEADNGDDIAYYLGTHLDEARSILAMPTAAQIRAIGRLEAKLSAEPPKQKTPSKAPAPIKPVGGKSGGANDMPNDTDDIKTWMKKENARSMKLRTG